MRSHFGRSALLCVGLAACGGGGSGGDGGDGATTYAAAFDEICDTLAGELKDLDDPTDAGSVADNAKDAGELLDDALGELDDVDLPADFDEADELIKAFEDMRDAYESIESAADGGDAAGLTDAVSELTSLNDDASELADDIGAGECALSKGAAIGIVEADIEVVETTVTVADTIPPTLPPDTTPAPTTPPATDPPTTDPPTTTPVGGSTVDGTLLSSGVRTALDLRPGLIPVPGYVFEDGGAGSQESLDLFLSLAPSSQDASGNIASVVVYREDGYYLGFAFLFVPDAAMPDAIATDLDQWMDVDNVGVPASIGGLDGEFITRADTVWFVSGNPTGVIWIVGDNEADIEEAMNAFSTAVGVE